MKKGAKTLNFDVSTGLKRVLGRELITDDEVAIFELVKNSFDAGASTVHLFFDEDNVVVADNGSGMSFNDLKEKWLFVAYSSKREESEGKDFRDVAAERGHLAGSKGIGRFSSDRLGKEVVLQAFVEFVGKVKGFWTKDAKVAAEINKVSFIIHIAISCIIY